MQINSVSSSSFGQLYFDNIDLEFAVCSDLKKMNLKSQRDIFDLVRKSKKASHIDVFVTDNGEVYLKDKVNKGRMFIIGNAPILKKLQAALGYAELKEAKHQAIFDIEN